MRRFSLLASVGAASLLVVSIGLCQPTPRTKNTPPASPPSSNIDPPSGPVTTPIPPGRLPSQPNSPVAAYPVPMNAAPVGSGEKMSIKVYAVPDLVATVHARAPAPNPFAGNPELAQVMQQVQLQVLAAQAGAQGSGASEPSGEVTQKLERLKKALRVAAPKRTWEEGGGEGEIEVYPEGLCLIVRQTVSGHEAIADLLTQLRATQNVQIELGVELVSLEGIGDESTTKLLSLLNRELAADEVAELWKCGGKSAVKSSVRMANGGSSNGGLIPELPLQFTAVASADKKIVEFRTDLSIPLSDENAAMMQACSQSRTVTAGKSLAFLLGPEAELVLLVTPKVVDRTPSAAK